MFKSADNIPPDAYSVPIPGGSLKTLLTLKSIQIGFVKQETDALVTDVNGFRDCLSA